MAFDAGMTMLVANELRNAVIGSKVEKIYQPTKEDIILQIRCQSESRKLMFSANPSSARVCLTALEKENPKTPPMFCMLLRKHLQGAVITAINTFGFERVIEIQFSAYDDLGFQCDKYLVAEIMGKYSNIVLLRRENEDKKIISAVHPVDFSTSSLRQILPGMKYELPPPQDKADPLTETEDGFMEKIRSFPGERGVERFILDTYLGIAPVVAREISYVSGKPENVAHCSPRIVWKSFDSVVKMISGNSGKPFVAEKENKPYEFSYIQMNQYGEESKISAFETFSEMFDYYYGKREQEQLMQARAHDIITVIGNVKHKIVKKLPLLKAELEDCDKADTYKLYGDLITASIYMLHDKADHCDVTNYYSENLETVTIPMDIKLTPSQNAAKYFKTYNKLKTAKSILKEQIEKAESELSYIESVETSLKFAESETDLSEIRYELGTYTNKTKKAVNQKQQNKKTVIKPKHYVSEHGYDIYVGKNNVQNDYLTTKFSKKSDWWFHVKNSHGSHVILVCEAGEEPDAVDFTQAAQLAAFFSELKDGQNVAVDYTHIKNVKKPSGSAPGFVTYSSNFTAYVNPVESCKNNTNV